MKNIISLIIVVFLSSQAYSETYPTLGDDLKLKFARSCSQTVRPWFSQAEYYEEGNENHFHEALIKNVAGVEQESRFKEEYSWFPGLTKIVNIDDYGADIETIIKMTAFKKVGGQKGWGVEKEITQFEYFQCIFLNRAKGETSYPSFFAHYEHANRKPHIYGKRLIYEYLDPENIFVTKKNAIVWVQMPGDYPCDDFDNQVSMIYCKGKEKGLWHTPLHVIDYPVSKDIPSWNFKTDK